MSKATVLVIEDDDASRQLASYLLEAAGHRLLAAEAQDFRAAGRGLSGAPFQLARQGLTIKQASHGKDPCR